MVLLVNGSLRCFGSFVETGKDLSFLDLVDGDVKACAG
jgi:hypothetical protein